ncbi:hypothetical protein L596_008449 [Steinernema carpocapsae]|uniref:Uncharacterized protein n=1 Tax=Steinernema carpocapsae TaxID=34508 RepID=A0A4U5PCI5_STECR|nr:hypothetical protein L596_008449 [Steinernema carpocapsae]
MTTLTEGCSNNLRSVFVLPSVASTSPTVTLYRHIKKPKSKQSYNIASKINFSGTIKRVHVMQPNISSSRLSLSLSLNRVTMFVFFAGQTKQSLLLPPKVPNSIFGISGV